MNFERLKPVMLFITIVALTTTALVDSATAARLQKKQERKFPSEWCPIDTNFLGSFTSETGCIVVTFIAINGWVAPPDNFFFFDNRLDNVVVIEASEFQPPNTRDSGCYNNNIVPELDPSYPLLSNPAVPFYEPFNPLLSPNPWDETQGATINAVDGWIELGNASLGDGFVQTSVVISGLTPNVPYVIHGLWHCNPLSDAPGCTGGSACLEVIVDDLDASCNPVPVEETTWGTIKSLYSN
jgi:hypothetical protein